MRLHNLYQRAEIDSIKGSLLSGTNSVLRAETQFMSRLFLTKQNRPIQWEKRAKINQCLVSKILLLTGMITVVISMLYSQSTT